MAGRASIERRAGEQVTRHRKDCSRCTAGTVALLASAVVAYPQARDAAGHLRR